MRLLFATTNAGKVAELAELLGPPFEVVSLGAFPQVSVPEESAETLEGNAELKARYYAQATGLWALADDSGLCVDALNGGPGVHSARYAEGDDRARCQKLLQALAEVPEGKRQAAFRCALCLAQPNGRVWVEVGECRGLIGRQARGEGGFGYDPVFVLPSGKTMAELTRAQKSAISHRGEAFRRMRPHLAALLP